MSIAIGSFAPQSADFYSRMVIRAPAPKPAAPPPTTVAPPRFPTSRLPAPTTATGDPIITPVTLFKPVQPVLKEAPPINPAPDAPTTTTSTGTTTQGPTGGGGTNDLLGAMSQLFQPTPVQAAPLATVQYAPTGEDGSLASSSSSGMSPAVIIVLLLVVGGGIYMLKKRAAK